MSEPEVTNGEDRSDSTPPKSDGGGPPTHPTAEQAAEPTSEDRLATAQAESARLRDQLLRTAADFDNYRKRTRRELDDAQRRGKESVLKELLPVFDNIERAATHADTASDGKSLIDGLRIVLKQFGDTMAKLGVKRIAAVGLPFNPSHHEAIQHLESPDVPAGVVLAEIQPGYTIGDQLLRAALVVVSKGPPES